MSKEVSFQIIQIEKTENNFFGKGLANSFLWGFAILPIYGIIDTSGLAQKYPLFFHKVVIITISIWGIAFIFFLIGSIINWKGNKMAKIGQLDIDQDEAYIKINGEKKVLQNSEYGISFVDEGYDGKNNYHPLVRGSFTSDISNGINTIAFINKKHEHPIIEFQIYVENYRKMDTLLEIVAFVNRR